MEGNLRFKIDWASLIVGRKFTVFVLFFSFFCSFLFCFVVLRNVLSQFFIVNCFVLLCISGQLPSTGPWWAYIWRGDLTEVFFALQVWGAYIWRGLYTEGLIFGILQ